MHSINLFTFEFKLTFKWFISWFSPKTTSNMASNSKLPNATWYLILGQEETYPFSNEIVSGLHCHFAFRCKTFVFSLFQIHTKIMTQKLTDNLTVSSNFISQIYHYNWQNKTSTKEIGLRTKGRIMNNWLSEKCLAVK